MGAVIDILILALVTLMTLRGLRRGAISTLVSLASYAIAFLVATVVFKTSQVQLEQTYGDVGFYLVILPAVFIITIVLVRLAGRFVTKAVSLTLAGPANKALGGLMGFAKAVVVVAAFVVIAVRLTPIGGEWYLGSQVFVFLMPLLP